MKYYYTIGEVCNLLDLKPHIIRYWETEFKQINSRRSKGANRRYSMDQVKLLEMIKDMLYIQKFTIKGVKKKLAQLKAKERHQVVVKAIGNDYKEDIIGKLTAIRDMLNEAFEIENAEQPEDN